jgi:hypothetical protein
MGHVGKKIKGKRLKQALANIWIRKLGTQNKITAVNTYKGTGKSNLKEKEELNFKFSIKENAIDSFNEALLKYEQGEGGDLKAFKFAISHLSHTIELVLKMYLQTLNENLIFNKCYQVVYKRSKADGVNLLIAFKNLESDGYDFNGPLKGVENLYTVNTTSALEIAKCELCEITGANFVDKDFIEDINWMKDLRNSIEHFQFEYSAKEVRLCLGRLVRGLSEFNDAFSLFDLEQEVGKDRYHVFKVLDDAYKQELKESSLDIKEAKRLLFSGVRLKNQLEIEWNEYTCGECGNQTLIPNENSSTGYRCTM